MKEQFVPYEIALKLKEKGFDEPCFGFYKSNGEYEDYHSYRNGKYYLCNTKTISKLLDGENIAQKAIAPLWQQVIDWLCEVHNIEVDALRYTYSGGVYQEKCYMWFVGQYDPKYNHELEEDDNHWILNERKSQGYEFKTKPEAISAGIEYALTLI